MGFIKRALFTGIALILVLMTLRTVFFRFGIHSSFLGVCPAILVSSVVQWPTAVRLPLPEELSLGNEVIGRFRAALRFKTISDDSGRPPEEQLLALIDFFQREFPLVHSSPFIRRELISNYSLLFTVSSGDHNDAAVDSEPPPFLIIAHTDVVPGDVLGAATNASNTSASGWSSQPFAAELRDGFIYGRGSMDCKLPVLGILEALEVALKSGFRPKRTFFIAFGHDEEVFGLMGAKQVAAVLEARGVRRLQYILDEGMVIVERVLPGLSRPIAMIGTAEKRQMEFTLRASAPPAHGSMQLAENSNTILAKAIRSVQANPMPSHCLQGPERQFLERVSRFASLPLSFALSNLWLFGPLVCNIFGRSPQMNALIRTTQSVTLVRGGEKVNVQPSNAFATYDIRLHPFDEIDSVIEHTRHVVADERVAFSIRERPADIPIASSCEAHDSPADCFGWNIIAQSIHRVFGEQIVVTPGLMIGATDSRHYTRFTRNIYRFEPLWLADVADAGRIHGFDERVSVHNYELAIRFYYSVLVLSDALTPLSAAGTDAEPTRDSAADSRRHDML